MVEHFTGVLPDIDNILRWVGRIITLFILFYITNRISHAQTNHRTLPPGPKRWPIVGSLFSVSKLRPWIAYKKWSETYGDIMYFEVLGSPTIVLGSHQAAIDLLEKRSAIHSDRPHTPAMALVQLTSWDLALLKYGSWWRSHRRVFQQHYNRAVVPRFHVIQLRETRRFLRNLMLTPDYFMNHIRNVSASIILCATYGEDVLQKHLVGLVSLALSTADFSERAMVPGTYWVDYFPLLRFVPGAGFQRELARLRNAFRELIEQPFSLAKEAKKETESPSVVADMLDRLSAGDNSSEEIAKNVAAIAFIAGGDTSKAVVQSFFLAMAMFPTVQQKAQEELDAVIGPARLPEFADRSSLTYINALIMECLRWHPAIPLGIVHKSIADDVYRGYFIPKGTMIIANLWAILHDPETYPEPEVFRPERFIKDGHLDPSVKDPTAAFGFGRRICPGRHFADASLFIVIASVLHVLHIERPSEEEHRLPDEPQTTSGMVSSPEPFKCSIKVRSPAAQILIQSV